MKPKVKKLVQRAIELQRKIDRIKKLYRELDEVEAALRAAGFDHARVGGVTVSLVDNFYSQNVAFRTTSVRRFELKITL